MGQDKPPFILPRHNGSDDAALEHGNGLSRIMVTVPDSNAAAERLVSSGFSPTTPNGPLIFFGEDPGGYRYEILQRRSRH